MSQLLNGREPLEILDKKPSESGSERRRKFLDEVAGCVCKDRNNSYGECEDNFAHIATIWNVSLQDKLKEPLDAVDVAILMLGVKLSRMVSSRELRDHWVDIAGYAACGASIVDKLKSDE